MPEYVRTQISELVTVRSVVTVFYRMVGERKSVGESHDFPELLYVDSGTFRTAVDGVPIQLEAGELILYAPNSFHGFREPTQLEKARVGIISFESDSSCLAALYNRPIQLNAEQREQFSVLIRSGTELYEEVQGRKDVAGMIPHGDAGYDELQGLKNRLELFLLDLCRTSENSDRPAGSNQEHFNERQMKALTEFLLARLGENLSLAEMAGAMGISVSKLRRLVHSRQGEGANAYFLRLKIKEAKRMIRETPMSMTEIAEQLGFSSLHYFSRQFKARTGKSPTEYAKSIEP